MKSDDPYGIWMRTESTGKPTGSPILWRVDKIPFWLKPVYSALDGALEFAAFMGWQPNWYLRSYQRTDERP